MALKGSLRNKRSKRMCNVLEFEASKSEETNLSSSDSESGVSFGKKNKVREEFSTKRLLKDNECYKIDGDHIYSSVNSPSTVLYNSKRKRNMSEESDDRPAKQKCFSKNAVMARLNRERKKQYISSLETENESLRKQNTEMRQEVENQNKNIFSLRREILYLKGLLANSKELGQILRNLNETTGLPVTSSIVLTGGNEEKTLEKSRLTDVEDGSMEEYQPRIRSVHSGSNFPILDKDIYLSSCSDKSSGDVTDFEHYPFDFENDGYDLQSSFLTDDNSFFNFNSQNLDLELEEPLKFQDFSKRDPNIGICLHVSQKKVSVEICSICNSRAGSSLGDLPNELF